MATMDHFQSGSSSRSSSGLGIGARKTITGQLDRPTPTRGETHGKP